MKIASLVADKSTVRTNCRAHSRSDISTLLRREVYPTQLLGSRLITNKWTATDRATSGLVGHKKVRGVGGWLFSEHNGL